MSNEQTLCETCGGSGNLPDSPLVRLARQEGETLPVLTCPDCVSDVQTRTLRAPCEHGHYDYHVTHYNTMGQVMGECEGWREIVIDYQAARNFVASYVASGGGSYPPVKAVIDIALGVRDE